MSKLMLVMGLFAALVLTDPPRFLGYFGPQANLVGWKIKRAIDVSQYLPNLRWVGL